VISEERRRALELAQGLEPTPKHLQKVAGRTSPEAARWAFEQWSLRQRAAAKFSRAGEMLFTREALEQATHEQVAEHRAARFPQGAVVADLTCGIGGDLLALARRGPSTGYELDPARAAIARHNLAVHGLQAEVREEDGLAAASSYPYAVADPARRQSGRRTLDPAEFEPNPLLLADLLRGMRLAAIKLSPMLPDDFFRSLLRERDRLEFVSFGGECREAVVWLGEEAGQVSPHSVFAAHVESGTQLPGSLDPPATAYDLPTADDPDAFFFEADPAAIRAHALAQLCAAYGLRALGDSNGYLTGPRLVDSPWLKAYRTLAHHPADLKRTRAALAELDASTPELKQRGAKFDLVSLRKQFRREGSRLVAIALWTVGKSVRHTIIEPVTQAPA
jgi:hypothetical protein